MERVEKALSRSSVAVLAVSGMGCSNCAMRVRNGLLRQAGVVRVLVSLENRLAWVNFDVEQLTVRDLVNAVAQEGLESNHGYKAEVMDVIP